MFLAEGRKNKKGNVSLKAFLEGKKLRVFIEK